MPLPSSPRVTLAQVAAHAGVSVMTASYTYNRPERVSVASRSRVLEAAVALGYPGPDPSAQSLRRGATRTLGIVLGEHLTYAFDDPQATQFLAGIAEVCAERGYGMTLLPITGAAQDVDRVRAAAVDAFIVWTVAQDDPVIGAVVASRRPAVVHGGPGRPGLAVVSIDNRAAARAIGTLVFAGARRPAILSFPLDRARQSGADLNIDPEQVLFPVTRDRLLGFRDAARDLGFEWQALTVAVCASNDVHQGQEATEAMLSRPDPPDAVAAMSDELALGALQAAGQADLTVPGDLAVSGWDDGAVASRHDLTTVHQSLRAQGITSALAVLGGAPLDTAADWTVVVRGSTR